MVTVTTASTAFNPLNPNPTYSAFTGTFRDSRSRNLPFGTNPIPFGAGGASAGAGAASGPPPAPGVFDAAAFAQAMQMAFQGAMKDSLQTPMQFTMDSIRELLSYQKDDFDINKYLSNFDGNRIKWPEWKAQWQEAEKKMDDRRMSPVDKYRLIRTKLTGTLGDIARSYSLHDPGSYRNLMKMLTDEFDDPTRAIKTAMDALMKVEPVKDNNIASLTKLKVALAIVLPVITNRNELTAEQALQAVMMAIGEHLASTKVKQLWRKEVEKKMDHTHPLGTTATIEDLQKIIERELGQMEIARQDSKPKKTEDKGSKDIHR